MRFILITGWLSVFALALNAQIPSGYYNSASGLSGSALKSALHNIIDNHNSFPYTSSSTDVWDCLMDLDEDPSNSSNVILIYKQSSLAKSSSGSGVNNWNREHLWPKSHGDFGTSQPTGTDLFNLRPSDVSVNSNRGDLDFDAGGSAHSEATLCNYDADSWEPADDVKGDIARSMFYMAVRYEGDSGSEPDLELVDYDSPTSSNNGYLGWISTLMQWHYDDPVDANERARNDAIYYSYQNNRNPFIDSPDFAARLWPAYVPAGSGSDPEPDNHAADFKSGYMDLSWTDATGGTLPDGYLVLLSTTSFGDITTPTDGTDPSSYSGHTVLYGAEALRIGGLTQGTTYYVKIFPYTGSGASTDYKTDGSIPQVQYDVP